ncbi:MAG: glycosyltransferase family 2 protein [Candidatus Pacebacteria bacterium]|nr:glycosyltransferase family 2 protein [Candidatus Paceibacterota bacterium]
MKSIIIIPAYNEEENIGKVVRDVCKVNPEDDILVVNDGSSDRTGLTVKEIQKAKLINLPYNLGIGGAVQAGFKYAMGLNYDLVTRMDGDGQHQASEIKRIKEPVLKGEADVSIGSRFLDIASPKSILGRRIGQKLIGLITSLVSGQKITDATSGFRCYNKKALALLTKFYPSDYPEPEEIIFLKKNKFKVRETGVLMKERKGGTSSLNVIKSIYYAIKVSLSIFINILRTPLIK